MKNTMRTTIAAAVMSVAATGAVLGVVGTGPAAAATNYKLGPYPTVAACQQAQHGAWIPVSGCFHDFWPVQGYYYWGQHI